MQYRKIVDEDLSLNPSKTVQEVNGKKYTVAQLTIPKGETQSKDSITIAYTKKMNTLSDTLGYLIPVRIRSYKGLDTKIDYNERISYLKINVAQQNGVYSTYQTITVLNAPATDDYTNLDGIEFKLSSFFETASNTKVQLSVNNSLIAAWNEKTGDNYQPIPQEDFNPVEVTFAKGAIEASGKISYTGDYTTLSNPKGYLIPYEITSVTGENIKEVTAKKVVYVIVDINNRTCTVADDDSTLGTKVAATATRAKYKVVRFVDSNGIDMTGNIPIPGAIPNYMFTDDNAQFWVLQAPSFANPNKLNITVDLSADVKNITGLLLEGFQLSVSMNMKAVDIKCATSSQGASGMDTAVGRISMTEGRQMLYIEFSEPITGRYIKLNNMTATSSANILGLRQFYIYTN
jgi:hypothetical protein